MLLTTWEEWFDAGNIPLKLAAPLLVCGPHFKDCELTRAGMCAVQMRGLDVLEEWQDLQGGGLCRGIEYARSVDRLNKLMGLDPFTLTRGDTTLQKIIEWAQGKKSVTVPQGLLSILHEETTPVPIDKEFRQFIEDIVSVLKFSPSDRMNFLANGVLTYGEAQMLSGLDSVEFEQSVRFGMLKIYGDAPANELRKTTYILQDVVNLACTLAESRKIGTMQTQVRGCLSRGIEADNAIYMAVKPVFQEYVSKSAKEAIHLEIVMHILALYIKLKGANPTVPAQDSVVVRRPNDEQGQSLDALEANNAKRGEPVEQTELEPHTENNIAPPQIDSITASAWGEAISRYEQYHMTRANDALPRRLKAYLAWRAGTPFSELEKGTSNLSRDLQTARKTDAPKLKSLYPGLPGLENDM